MKKKKKVNKRKKAKFPALNPKLNVKKRQWLIDFDYVDKLDEKTKAWLNEFVEKHYNASFNGKKQKIKMTKQDQTDAEHRNYINREDILTNAKVGNKIDSIETIYKNINNKIDD